MKHDSLKTRPRLGVLGGMGPLATAVFYSRIVERSAAYTKRDQDHIDTVIYSDCQMPDRTEAILTGQTDALLERCAQDFDILEYSGCDAICFPCNTLHYFMDELKTLTSLPIIDMIEVSISRLRKEFPDVSRIQIFATDGTRNTGLYERAAKKHGLEVVDVDDETQKEVMGLIYELKKTGQTAFPRLSELILNAQSDGIDKVLLACTELSCMEVSKDAAPYAYDTLNSLVDECVEYFLVRPSNRLSD